MKKLVVLGLLLFSFIFIGCGGQEKNAPDILLSFVTQDSPDSPAYEGYIAFKQKLEELSGGTMSVEPITLSTKDTLGEMFGTIATGQFDIVKTWYWDMEYIIPELHILSEVYLIKDYEHLMRILASEYGQKMQEQFNENGVIASSVWYAGMRYVTSNTPISSLADFKGLKYRVPPTKSIVAFAEAMGTKPVATTFANIYDSLKNGTIEAQGNPLLTIDAIKLYEVQKYMAITEHLVGATALFINMDKYNSFTDKQKAWYDEATEYGRIKCAEFVYEKEAHLLEQFENEYGITLTYPNKEELRAAMQNRYETLEKEYGSELYHNIMDIE